MDRPGRKPASPRDKKATMTIRRRAATAPRDAARDVYRCLPRAAVGMATTCPSRNHKNNGMGLPHWALNSAHLKHSGPHPVWYFFLMGPHPLFSARFGHKNDRMCTLHAFAFMKSPNIEITIPFEGQSAGEGPRPQAMAEPMAWT